MSRADAAGGESTTAGKALAVALIYAGTCFYTAASFYHLKLKHWTFWRGYALAIPLVCVEYVFNIWGNKLATLHGLNVVQIMMLIISFYMVNIWVLNVFVLKQRQTQVVAWREALALALLVGAIAVSSNMLALGHHGA